MTVTWHKSKVRFKATVGLLVVMIMQEGSTRHTHKTKKMGTMIIKQKYEMRK